MLQYWIRDGQGVVMNLNFERGKANAPAGHALVYFTSSADGSTLAVYLVVLPITLQLSKYIPPMLAAQLPIGDLKGTGALPMPPVPEPVESQAWVNRLAELRRDDLIDGGRLNPSDLGRSMSVVAEIAQQYAQLYEAALAQLPAAPTEEVASDAISDVSAGDVIYGLMSDEQRLAELAKLAGQLRYAVDGGDARQADDLAAEILRLSKHVPATYRIDEFVEAARKPGTVGRDLATLYLDRCYRLAREDYTDLGRIERDIARLRGTS
jgi:hypothetical protein